MYSANSRISSRFSNFGNDYKILLWPTLKQFKQKIIVLEFENTVQKVHIYLN